MSNFSLLAVLKGRNTALLVSFFLRWVLSHCWSYLQRCRFYWSSAADRLCDNTPTSDQSATHLWGRCDSILVLTNASTQTIFDGDPCTSEDEVPSNGDMPTVWNTLSNERWIFHPLALFCIEDEGNRNNFSLVVLSRLGHASWCWIDRGSIQWRWQIDDNCRCEY